MPNSNKKMSILRVIALGLVLCICINIIMAPKAHAISELIIVGAAALTIATAAAVVILCAEPMGYKDALMSASQHFFQTPKEFAADLLDRFGASQGMQRLVMLDTFQKGLLITAAGEILLDKALSDLITTFSAWAWSADGGALVNFAPIPNQTTDYHAPASNTIGMNFTSWPAISSSNSLEWMRTDVNPNIIGSAYVTSGSPVGCIWSTGAGTSTFVLVSYEPFSVTYTALSGRNQSASVTSQTTTNGWSRYLWTFTVTTPAQVITGTINDLTGLTNAGLGAQYILLNGTPELVGGTSPSYNDDELVLPAPGYFNKLNVPGALTLPAPIAGTATADNYLDAAADAIITGTGTLTYDDAQSIERTGTLTGTGTIETTQETSQTVEQSGAIEAAESVGSTTLDNYTIDLKDFFPFCIPFDLYKMINLLNSAPAPVSVDWTFDFGEMGTYALTIDLAEFDSAAKTLRTMELLSFCYGLAMLTKRILMGS